MLDVSYLPYFRVFSEAPLYVFKLFELDTAVLCIPLVLYMVYYLKHAGKMFREEWIVSFSLKHRSVWTNLDKEKMVRLIISLC